MDGDLDGSSVGSVLGETLNVDNPLLSVDLRLVLTESKGEEANVAIELERENKQEENQEGCQNKKIPQNKPPCRHIVISILSSFQDPISPNRPILYTFSDYAAE